MITQDLYRLLALRRFGLAKGGRVEDLARKYDTELEPDAEVAFERFRRSLPENLRSDFDFDLRGAWLAGERPDGRGHMTDRFKKPNHPTFSDQSQYSSAETPGGRWTKGGGHEVFWASPYNQQQHPLGHLAKYLEQGDPGVTMIAQSQYRLPR